MPPLTPAHQLQNHSLPPIGAGPALHGHDQGHDDGNGGWLALLKRHLAPLGAV